MKTLNAVALTMVCLLPVVASAAEKPGKKKGQGQGQGQKRVQVPAESLPGVPDPRVINFPVLGESLQGYLYVPEGPGPFRAMVWNYGASGRLLKQGPPSIFQTVAKVYLSDDYVLLIPDRRSGAGPEGLSNELKEKLKDHKDDPKIKAQKFIETSEATCRDVLAAIEWLKGQSFVDKNKIFISGAMNGATHALLAAEKDPGVRAVVAFSPGGTSWETKPGLQTLLRRTVRTVRAPIFLIQPQNDVSLGPIQALGRDLERKGGLNRIMVYPAYGKTEDDARRFSIDGWDVWGYDVLTFLDKAVETGPSAE